MSVMKKLASLVVLALLLTGCAASPQAGSAYSADDINFAEMMIPHHEQAIEMSELAFMNSTNSAVLALAQEIKDAQEPEIELMKSWAGVSPSTHAGHTMDGMLSSAEIAELGTANSPAFDRLFLQGMIKHHEGAIDMAEAVTSSKNQEVADLAVAIIDAQLKEITLMKELISNL